MNETDAINKAEALIALLLQHQPGLYGSNPPLATLERAKQGAQALAVFRAELIAQLMLQP